MQKFPRSPIPTRNILKAFTLIELLAVISITAILAALLMPAISRGLKKAQNVQNLANLRQLGTLASQYSGENNGAFLPGKDADGQQWQVLLARLYAKEMIEEPAML